MGSQDSLAGSASTPTHSSSSLPAPNSILEVAGLEGEPLAAAGVVAAAAAPAADGTLPLRPQVTASRLRRRSSSQEGSRHGGSSARVALLSRVSSADEAADADAAAAAAVEAEAEAGIQATAGRLAVAAIEVAAEALPELEPPATPAASSKGEAAPAGAAAAAAAEEEPPLFESPR